MFSPDISVMIIQEIHKDILRELAHQKLVAEALAQHSDSKNLPRHVVARLGKQMVKLGAKLQSFDTPSANDNLVIKKA